MKKIYDDILDKYSKKHLRVRNADTPGNLGIILEGTGSNYFLKLNTKKSLNRKSKKQLQDEINFINFLNKHKIPAIQPIKMADGRAIYSFNGARGYATKWLKYSYKRKVNLRDITAVAKTIAKMHLVGQRFYPESKRKSWSLKSTKYYLKHNKQILPIKIYEHILKQFDEIKLSYDLPRGFIHEDMGRRHFLWNNEKIVGILDFDRAYTGFFICDLAQTIRGWCIEGQTKPRTDLIEAFLKEYDKIRKLSEIERKYFYNALRFAALERANSYATRYAISSNVSFLLPYNHFLGQDKQIVKIKSQVEDLLHKLP